MEASEAKRAKEGRAQEMEEKFQSDLMWPAEAEMIPPSHFYNHITKDY